MEQFKRDTNYFIRTPEESIAQESYRFYNRFKNTMENKTNIMRSGKS